MKIITVCGSLKYKDEIINIALELQIKGNCVLTPIFPTDNDITLNEDELQSLGNAHKEKIRISDTILVVDINGYIGNQTESEIKYAESLNKEVIYYSKLKF